MARKETGSEQRKHEAEQFELPINWGQVVEAMRIERAQFPKGKKPRVRLTSCGQVQLVFNFPGERL